MEETIAGMTTEEKIGQLFFNMGSSRDEEYLKMTVDKYHIGGIRYNPATGAEVREQNRILQENSKIPLIIACNTENGGNGACTDGTMIGQQTKIGATRDARYAYELGRMSNKEAAAIGCNLSFAPVSDILYNWENPVIGLRTYGNDVNRVCEMTKAYMDGAHTNEGFCCAAKHFPGDGLDFRDQHVADSVNDMSCEEWDASYGKVYQNLIDNGLEAIMAGHIMQPAYTRHFNPGIKDEDIMPATLSPELIERYHIGITPLYIIRGEETLRDGIDVRPEELYEYANATGKLCKTAAVNVSDYLAYFAACREEYDAVIHFTISSDMSACYQNACIAAQEFTNVYPVDSRNLSTGIGHLVLDAAEMAEQGMDAADIASALEKKREKLDVSFVIDTLEYLKRGGRCSALVAMSANLLHLKPCIEVKDGKMGVGHKYRGKLEKCYVQYIEERLKGRDDIDCHRIFITDSGCDEATWRELERVVRACQPFEEVIHTRAGCTVSNHCGPGCMGILYYHK